MHFAPLQGSAAGEIGVLEHYEREAPAAWGQPLTNAAPEFGPENLDPAAQRRQAGYNCGFAAWSDYVHGSGIVGVNHECANPRLMLRDYSAERAARPPAVHCW